LALESSKAAAVLPAGSSAHRMKRRVEGDWDTHASVLEPELAHIPPLENQTETAAQDYTGIMS